MTTIVYASMPRADVIPYLGPAWPPAEGATVLRCPNPAGVEHGAVIVYETDGMPGITWWLVDSVIPPQGAGPVGEQLAALIPDSALEVVPTPPPDTPPDTPSVSAHASPSNRPVRAEPRHQEGQTSCRSHE